MCLSIFFHQFSPHILQFCLESINFSLSPPFLCIKLPPPVFCDMELETDHNTGNISTCHTLTPEEKHKILGKLGIPYLR